MDEVKQNHKLPEDNALPVQDRLGFLITRTSWAVRSHMDQFIRSLGVSLSPEQWIALNWLYNHPGSSQQDLVEVLGKHKANITRILAGLAKQGYVYRSEDPKDRRRVLLSLSSESNEMMNQVLPQVLGEYHYITQDLGPQEKAAVKSALAKITKRALERKQTN